MERQTDRRKDNIHTHGKHRANIYVCVCCVIMMMTVMIIETDIFTELDDAYSGHKAMLDNNLYVGMSSYHYLYHRAYVCVFFGLSLLFLFLPGRAPHSRVIYFRLCIVCLMPSRHLLIVGSMALSSSER